MASFKLLLGQTYGSWRQFPQQRQAFRDIPPGPPILVTGAYRSGTTWVGSMLAPPGVWHLHEPFNPLKGLWSENFSYLPADQPTAPVDTLIADLLGGRLIRADQRPLLRGVSTAQATTPARLGLYPTPPQRVLIKDPIACLMSAYLCRRFDFQTLVIFRHPAGFVSSLKKLGWDTAWQLREFLDRPRLMADWLEPYRSLIKTHSVTSDIRSAAVLHGCLNRILWEFVQTNPSMEALLFEQLCDNPLETFQSLYARLGLPYGEAAAQRHRVLTSEIIGKTEYRPHEIVRDSRAMSTRWQSLLSPSEVATIRQIWQQFEIPLYQNDEDWAVAPANPRQARVPCS